MKAEFSVSRMIEAYVDVYREQKAELTGQPVAPRSG